VIPLPALGRYISAVALLALTGGTASAQQVRALFERASQSVVVVRTVEKTLAPVPSMGLVSARGLGSGTIISSDRSVLTAAHVVQTADRVGVELQDGRLFMARVVASSPRGDVALLQMESPPRDLVPARIGDSDSLRTGDEVMVIGAPYGLGYTLSVGHVSGRLTPRQTVSGVPLEFIQTDAHISQGNSGGPMFNLRGEVVGIVSWMLTQSGGYEGLGFAVSANVAKRLLASRGSFWTGVEGVLLTGELARVLNVPQPAGLLIQRVAAGSPGAALGLEAGTLPVRVEEQVLLLGGDIVLEIAGIQVSDSAGTEDRIDQHLRAQPAGSPITVRVLRDGRTVTLTAPKQPSAEAPNAFGECIGLKWCPSIEPSQAHEEADSGSGPER
jgi:serine protease Do